jgi:mRNA interferase MazF
MKRFDVFVVDLEPVRGSEIKKARPCVIVSPDDLNPYLRTVIIAPLTTIRRAKYRYRVDCRFQNKIGSVALDQIRVVDKSRLLKHLGHLSAKIQQEILTVLGEMFAP